MADASFSTTDDVEIAFTDTGGAGTPLVAMFGWGQHKEQLPAFPGRRVITVDHRGHGASGKPRHGYRMGRLAQDLTELLDHLDLDVVDGLGHSMGASVWWGHIDLHGTGRLRRLVCVDQPAAVAAVPWMSQAEAQQCGAIASLPDLLDLGRRLSGPDGPRECAAFVRGMFPHAEPDPQVWDQVAAAIALMPGHVATQLLLAHASADWRDVLGRIDVPTLVVACDSHVSVASQQYLAEQMQAARLEQHPVGHHFPFLQEPDEFVKLVAAFLDEN